MKPNPWFIASMVMVTFFAGVMVESYKNKKETQEITMSNSNMIEKVEVRIGYTLNAGNYESVRVDLGVTRFMGEGESTTEIMTAMREQLRKELQKAGQEELKAFQPKRR